MQPKANSVEQYLKQLPEDRKAAVTDLRNVLKKNLPTGFEETMGWGMPAFVVPHSKYPDGYHCDPEQALPFISIASQKNFIALYHMGIYADPKLLNWFTLQYPKYVKGKLDMGKSCIRFKKPDQIPYTLLGELASKVTPEQWIKTYESIYKKK